MATSENVFNFDVSPFLNGINNIGKGMDRMQVNAKKFGEVITGSIGKAFNGLAVKAGIIFGAVKTLGAALKTMPEVGEAFGIAKDVFLKNLLWPLRQQVMPLLQKMLDWVRDNRAQFAKWGVAVANVFRTVVVVARTLWDVFKNLVEVVGNAFQKAFKTNFKSFDDFVNVLSFKISAVLVYLGMLAKELATDFKPAFEWIIDMGASVIDFFFKLAKAWGTANQNGDSLWTLMDKLKTTMTILAGAVEAAWKGFKDGFLSSSITQAMTPLNSIIESLNRLLGVLGLKDTDGLRGAFNGLGLVLGTLLQGALASIAVAFDGIVTTLGTLISMMKILSKLSQGDWVGAGKQFAELGDAWKGFGARTAANAASVFPGPKTAASEMTTLPVAKKHNDVIITKRGEVHETSPDDNIFAAKDFSGFGKKNIALQPATIGPFYVTVTEGNAERAGRKLAEGIEGTFRNKVSSAKLAEGY